MIRMDSPKLRELTRTQLQSLAKQEVVRAVGKTEDIIRRLTRKHPKGVPVPENADNPSVSLTPPKRNVLKKHRKVVPSPSSVPKSLEDREGGPARAVAWPSPSSSTEALEQLLHPESKESVVDPEATADPLLSRLSDEPVAGPSNTNLNGVSAPHAEVSKSQALSDHPVAKLIPSSANPPHGAYDEDNDPRKASPPPEDPDWQANEELDGEYDNHPKVGPNRHMVVDTLRQFTTLVNTIPSMKTRIAENRCILQRTESLLQKATPDARELTVTREYLEKFLLAKMKTKRELWDGTGRMKKKARKFRMEWLRAERKAANEKRWKEANELNKRQGLAPEPLSTFISESDEEEIESLQTTPASSRSGGSKRSREELESVGAESDRDGDADDENQRKRPRS